MGNIFKTRACTADLTTDTKSTEASEASTKNYFKPIVGFVMMATVAIACTNVFLGLV